MKLNLDNLPDLTPQHRLSIGNTHVNKWTGNMTARERRGYQVRADDEGGYSEHSLYLPPINLSKGF